MTEFSEKDFEKYVQNQIKKAENQNFVTPRSFCSHCFGKGSDCVYCYEAGRLK
jgi:hypothetical protein